MIKKLRKKLVAVAMLSLFIVLFIIIGTVNVLNYTRMVDDANRTLNILKENNGSFPRPDMSHGHGGEMLKGMSPEAPYESRYFSVMMDSNGNVSTIDTGMIAGTDTDEAAEYAVKALASGKTEGFMGQYRFTLKEADSGRLIIFLYCGRGLSNFHSVLFISTAISIAGMLAVFLLLVFFSGRIVKPVSESYDKQKRFITDAGHELKTPLTIIDADAELVELECGESEWLDDIRKQTKRLTSLTNDLIYLAKMEEGQRNTVKIEFPLSDVVEETAEAFRARAINENKKLELTKEGINEAMKAAATESFGYNTDEIVSSDVIGMKYGSLFDATQTMVSKMEDGNSLVQVVSWYDNENSYTSQMVRTIKYFAELA